MSNITLFSSANVPAFARNNELSETARALTGGGVSNSVKRISIKGGVFRLVAGGKEVAAIDDRHLNVIIVKAAPRSAVSSTHRPTMPTTSPALTAGAMMVSVLTLVLRTSNLKPA